MKDHRLATDEDIERMRSMLTAAVTLRGKLVSYAVQYQGATQTAIGFSRPDGVVPLAILLPQEVWADVPHMTDTHAPSKE